MVANDLEADLAVHARKAAERLQNGDPSDGRRPVGVSGILRMFEEESLLHLQLLDPAARQITGADLRHIAAAATGLASCSLTLASVFLVNIAIGGTCIATLGTAAQRHDLLPRLRRGKLELAFALTEPEAGSDASGIATSAILRDDGRYLLSGEKIYTTGANTADFIVTAARVGRAAGRREITLFLVPKNVPGLTIVPLEKLGGGEHPSCRVSFDSVELGKQSILGGSRSVGKAWNTLRLTGSIERLTVAAISAGIAGAIVERSLEFAASRRQFGRPIASYQSIRFSLVDMRTKQTAMQLFVRHAVDEYERLGESAPAIPMAKYVCADHLQNIVAEAMQIFGGRAYFAFETMSRHYREAPFCLYAGGTREVQKMLIARGLGLPE